MYEIITDIEIAGTPAQVWRALTDFQAYPQWNPAIRSIEGTAAVGQRLKITLNDDGPLELNFWVVVKCFIHEKEFRWFGQLLLPTLFAGEHFFIIQSLAPNRSRLIHGERFIGILKPIVWTILAKRNESNFITMNQALKAYVEGEL